MHSELTATVLSLTNINSSCIKVLCFFNETVIEDVNSTSIVVVVIICTVDVCCVKVLIKLMSLCR